MLGFSKSGWGACTLLLRNKELFGYAAAWDVPFMLNGKNSWDSGWFAPIADDLVKLARSPQESSQP